MKFTVFTPTYNRAHTLIRLYESLKSQVFIDFEWVLVDDGSTDGTEALIKSFIDEKIIKITYLKQSNQGKHIAINMGVKKAIGEFFLIVDSDDYLLANALEVCNHISEKVVTKDFAGFTFIHFSNKVDYDEKKYGYFEQISDKNDSIKYIWEYWGEMNFCYKTEIMKQFLFPQFEGEKFCPESLVHRRINRKYKILFTDNVLMRGDYMPDGLSSKYTQLMERSPRASMLSIKEKIQDTTNNVDKEILAKQYWNIALKAKHISWIEKFRGIPLGLSFDFWKKRLLKA